MIIQLPHNIENSSIDDTVINILKKRLEDIILSVLR